MSAAAAAAAAVVMGTSSASRFFFFFEPSERKRSTPRFLRTFCEAAASAPSYAPASHVLSTSSDGTGNWFLLFDRPKEKSRPGEDELPGVEDALPGVADWVVLEAAGELKSIAATACRGAVAARGEALAARGEGVPTPPRVVSARGTLARSLAGCGVLKAGGIGKRSECVRTSSRR